MNGRGRTKPYTMDDYIKDREQDWGKTAGTPVQAPKSSTGGFTVSRFTPPLPQGATSLQKQAADRRQQATGAVTAPTVEAPSVSVGSGTPESGTVGAVPLTDVDLAKYEMEQARQKVYDVLNRKFKYKAEDSPLYTILQKQYEKEAERAAGRAYASAVANTGGYGSSYATLSAEEARRQVMEGMDEAQYELYQAARQEFLDERESAVDWYNQTRQMYQDALTDEEYRKQLEVEAGKSMSDSTYQLLLEASNGGWYTGSNQGELRAKLETYAAGNPDIDVDTIMGHLEREYEARMSDTETYGVSEADPERVQAFYGAAYDVWDGTNEETVRTELKNAGATDAEIEETVGMLKSKTASGIEDRVKKYELSPTVSGAAAIMSDARATGNEVAVRERVSAGLSKSFTKAMDDLSIGYEVLGVDQNAWKDMSDEDKAASILDEAGSAMKAGTLSSDDYYNIVQKDLVAGITDAYKADALPINKLKGALNAVSGIMSLTEAGYLTAEQRSRLVEEILSNHYIQDSMKYWGDGNELLNDQINKNQEEAYALLWYTKNSGKRGGR